MQQIEWEFVELEIGVESNRILEFVSRKNPNNNNHELNYQTVFGISAFETLKQVNFPEMVKVLLCSVAGACGHLTHFFFKYF